MLQGFLKKYSAVILLIAFMLSFSSCFDDGKTRTTVNDIYLDDLPSDINYEGESVEIAYWDNEFVARELTADASSGEEIDTSVFKRNESVEERLGVNLEFVKGENAPEYFMPRIREDILAGKFDSDIIAGVQCQTADLCVAGCYYNLANAKYLDISKDYWNDEYINELRIGNDRLFMLGGDVSLTTTAWSAAMLINTEMYESVFGDIDQLYSLILDDQWTIDKMLEISKSVYSDVNGNGVRDLEDRFGLRVRTNSSIIDVFCFSSGVRYSMRDEVNLPILNVVNERSVSFCEKFCNAITSNEGVWTYDLLSSPDGYIDTLFISTDLDALRREERYSEGFGVIPYPMLDESVDKYYSWISDNTIVYSVPVTISEKRETMISAVLEAMASETRRLCLPVYYENAIGDKYTRDDASRKMLEIIHDGATADFVSIYSSSLNSLGGIMRQQVGAYQAQFESNYNAMYYNASNKLTRLIQTYDNNTLRKIVPGSSHATDYEIPLNDVNYIIENQIDEKWSVLGGKYRSSGVLLPKDYSSDFSYTVSENGTIRVKSPSVYRVSGAYPTAIIQSKQTTPLADLELTFNTDDGFVFNNVGYSASCSLVWTTMPIEKLPEYTDQIGTNGLREVVPAEKGAYALSVIFMGTNSTSGSISDLMYIILHDGTTTALEEDGRIGYRWTNYVTTDLSQGVDVKIVRDDELGFVVSVNGTEYRTGYRGKTEHSIDLTPLLDQEAGHICMGVGVTGADEYANFSMETINGKPAADYFE